MDSQPLINSNLVWSPYDPAYTEDTFREGTDSLFAGNSETGEHGFHGRMFLLNDYLEDQPLDERY